ncbi:hypothetical protein ACROYT_G021187 [Oculina patagonica]
MPVTPSQDRQEPGASVGAGTNAVEQRSGRGSKGKRDIRLPCILESFEWIQQELLPQGFSSQPQTPSEVRSLLGLVGFSARFIPDFTTTADPLRRLARKGKLFMWGDLTFQKLKSQVASAPVFDKNAPTRVIADASPVELGTVLVQ